MKILSFLMHGRYAHFCLPFTNINRLTQPCPTKTAIIGFLGAVLGREKYDYRLIHEDKIRCGVQIEKPYRTVSMSYLARQSFPSGTDKAMKASRIPIELIAEPCYRIYITGAEERLHEIRDYMKRNFSIYTPCLGLASLFARSDYQVSALTDVESVSTGGSVSVSGAFIRGTNKNDGSHGELDYAQIKNKNLYDNLRLSEFLGIKNISAPQQFEFAHFIINLESAPVPLTNVNNIIKLNPGNGEIYVPFF